MFGSLRRSHVFNDAKNLRGKGGDVGRIVVKFSCEVWEFDRLFGLVSGESRSPRSLEAGSSTEKDDDNEIHECDLCNGSVGVGGHWMSADHFVFG